MAALRLTSPAFAHDEVLPLRHTADGEDVSPPLAWTGVPEGTKELVLVCDDPDADAGVFTHWVVYGLAPEVNGLPEALPDDAIIDEPVSLVQGLNEFDEVGYRGPEPDEERGRHRLFFRLFALDEELDLPAGVTRAELRRAAKDHIIGSAELVSMT
ncbi:MAG: YbhB/YbcL family Raf kinase inhibitor-like protein [Nitriliruptorales bacterium]|nr:YbhB/YbcL family Raf kinase inhibitor-like protein [Nitriliruptorales bacterium]